MTITHRPFLLDAGEQLFLNVDALEHAARLSDFIDATGLEPEDLVAEPVLTVPLPVYSKNVKVAKNVAPELAWNPLFWLPEDVGLRYQLVEEDAGEPRVESSSEWAIRIGLELQASGLYDPDKGWLDVLALHGLDSESEETVERITLWQNGVPDEVLDAIDISSLFLGTTPEWAVASAIEMNQSLVPAQYALSAASLLGYLEENPESVDFLAGHGAEVLYGTPAADELVALAEREAPDKLELVSEQFESVILEYADALQAAAS